MGKKPFPAWLNLEEWWIAEHFSEAPQPLL